jgi:UTP--glucose-1-phosphate uridylyltransferase
VLAVRRQHGVRLPLLFMDSFRTRDDTLARLAAYDDLADPELPLDFLQNKEPKLRADDLTPVTWEADPSLEWCPPGHGDLYTALFREEEGRTLLDRMIEAGFTQAFVARPAGRGLVRRERSAVRDRGGAPHPQRPEGWPLRPPAQRRADHPPRDRADP